MVRPAAGFVAVAVVDDDADVVFVCETTPCLQTANVHDNGTMIHVCANRLCIVGL